MEKAEIAKPHKVKKNNHAKKFLQVLVHQSLYHSNKSRFFMFMKCAFFKCSRYGFTNKNSR